MSTRLDRLTRSARFLAERETHYVSRSRHAGQIGGNAGQVARADEQITELHAAAQGLDVTADDERIERLERIAILLLQGEARRLARQLTTERKRGSSSDQLIATIERELAKANGFLENFGLTRRGNTWYGPREG